MWSSQCIFTHSTSSAEIKKELINNGIKKLPGNILFLFGRKMRKLPEYVRSEEDDHIMMKIPFDLKIMEERRTF